MSGWWLIPAFAGGWLGCWYFGVRVIKASRLSKWLNDKAFRKMNHDALVNIVEKGTAELVRRKASVKVQ